MLRETSDMSPGIYQYDDDAPAPVVGPAPVKLEPLEGWNARRAAEVARERLSAQPQPNGLACPKCEQELADVPAGVRLLSDPPRVLVVCGCCGYRGSRLE